MTAEAHNETDTEEEWREKTYEHDTRRERGKTEQKKGAGGGSYSLT